MNLLNSILTNHIITGIIAFIILLPIVVFVHEFGHFLFARINGVKVEEFSIGFGKSILHWTDKHNTVWKIGLIPLGGYVKMLGQSDTPETTETQEKKRATLSATEKRQSFEFKQRYQKASIVLAGPLFNFLFSFIVFFAIFTLRGTPNLTFKVVSVEKDSPAYIAGIKQDDIITTINKKKIDKTNSISTAIQSSNGSPIEVTLLRDNKAETLTLTPKKKDDKYFAGIGYMATFTSYDKVSPLTALSLSYQKIKGLVTKTLTSLGEIITGKRSSKEIGGMISIAQVSGNALSAGLYTFIYLIAIISASLGLFNILPIPVLDGGYLFIYIIEGIMGRDLPPKIKEKLFLFGFIIIISLLLLSNINDIIRIIK